MKYELSSSLHVLETAEDHHALFVPWAKAMRQTLAPSTAADAKRLLATFHEWQLGSLLSGYDGPSRIDSIADYLRRDPAGRVLAWARQQRAALRELLLTPEEFGAFYAGFLIRYHEQGFGESWRLEHGPLIASEAARLSERVHAIDLELLARRTKRRFRAGTMLLLYPSSFSRPRHAYGFDERAGKAVLVRVHSDDRELVATVYHELLHPLLRGWSKPAAVRAEVVRLASEPEFRRQWEAHGRGSYDFPDGWVEELFVHAIARLLLADAGYLRREQVPDNAYCEYERAIHEALSSHHDALAKFGGIDGFIAHALANIRLAGDEPNAQYRYRPR